MAAAPSDDDRTTCPLCHVMLENENELQLHYLQSCAGYDNDGNTLHSMYTYMYMHIYIYVCVYCAHTFVHTF